MSPQRKTNGRAMSFVVPFLFVVLCYGLMQGYMYFHRNDWKKATTPLPKNRVEFLCENFELDESHELCNGKRDIYGPDFYDLIQEMFKPELNYRAPDAVPATYEQVEKMIGRFKIECEPIVWLAFEQRNYYRCIYDLRGDRKYLIFIGYYYPENTVYEIISPTQKEPHD
jgi:hypothetical protein